MKVYIAGLNPFGRPGPTPSGTATVSLDGTVAGPALQLPPSITSPDSIMLQYSYTAPTATGSHLLSIAYSGDATHAPSSDTLAFFVGNVQATGSFSLAVADLTVLANESTGTVVTATSSGGYNGRIVWSLSAASDLVNLKPCYSIVSLPVSGTSSTKLTIGLGSACASALPATRGNVRMLAPTASSGSPGQGDWPKNRAAAVVAGLLFCGLLVKHGRQRIPALLVLALMCVTASGLTGCGGNSSNATNNPTPAPAPSPAPAPTPAPAPATTYKLVLKGTDSVNTSISASTTFTLTTN